MFNLTSVTLPGRAFSTPLSVHTVVRPIGSQEINLAGFSISSVHRSPRERLYSCCSEVNCLIVREN